MTLLRLPEVGLCLDGEGCFYSLSTGCRLTRQANCNLVYFASHPLFFNRLTSRHHGHFIYSRRAEASHRIPLWDFYKLVHFVSLPPFLSDWQVDITDTLFIVDGPKRHVDSTKSIHRRPEYDGLLYGWHEWFF